ncbi:beta strand repeat-containing protein [Bradyrhizobium sp. AZCC 2230]|uniref:beta strand repeat-containing protein n=1 Tax=Bradyrhizobium sp. AZCC 2230 TaxID=3117021 RepID=UPI002FEFD679
MTTIVTSVTASPANDALQAGDTVTFTLAMSSAVTVSGGTPTLTLNDGGVAVYDAAATAALGDPTKMVFTYKVAAADQPVDGLSFVRGNYNGAAVVDATGQVPDFSGVYSSSFTSLQVETTGPGTPVNTTLFAGTDASGHVNLWVTDGTSAGTTELPVAGASSNGLQPTGFVSLGNKVLFSGMDAANHQTLWVSDGTASGTTKLSITGASATAFNPTNLTQVGNKVYFSGTDALGHTNIWITDGTAGGTSELFVPGMTSVAASGFTALGGKVLFSSGNDLWITDGTTAGTSKLSVAGASSPNGLQPSNLLAVGDKVLFEGVDAANQYGLWVTDGTAAGTTELSVAGMSYPHSFASIGDKVMFVAQASGSSASTLWITDGTSAGTSQLQIPATYTLSGLTAFGGKVIFQYGTDLWISDGTTAGTTKLAVSNASGFGIFSYKSFESTRAALTGANFTVVGNEVLFQGRDANDQVTLWRTDGTAAGTFEVPVSGIPQSLVTGRDFAAIGNKEFFVGPGAFADALWVTDGTSAGTYEVGASAAFSQYADAYAVYHPHFAALGSNVLFATTGLWVSDGTAAGTYQLSVTGGYGNGVFYNNRSYNSNRDTQFTVFGNHAVFSGLDASGAIGLFVTDGTNAGTFELSIAGAATASIPLSDYGLRPSAIQVFGDKVLFGGDDTANGYGLWITDGTSAGTTELVGGVSAFGHGAAWNVTVLGNKAVFDTFDANGKYILGVTDGTAAGTSELPVAGASATAFNPGAMAVAGNKVVFTGVDAAGKNALWATDGTSAGTSELFAGFGSAPAFYAQFGGKAMFRSGDAQPALWVTDGTAAGTTEFYIPAGASMYPSPLAVMSDRVLLVGTDTSGRVSLWSSDGTQAGTSELLIPGAFLGGSGGGIFTQMTPTAVTLGGKTYFTGRDASTNINLFVTDGTSAGSHEIVVNGAAATGLNPTNLSVVNGKIMFDGVDASGRTSLWVSDGTSAGTVELPSQPGSLVPGPFGVVNPPSPASVVSFTGSPASGVVHAGDTVTFTMTMSRGVTVSGGTPTLTLNDGGTAVYDAAATAALGDPTKMVFSCTVGASDLSESGLSFVRGDQNGAVIVDSSGNVPDFSGAFATSFSGIQVATAPTAVTSIVASPSNGVEKPGDTVTFTITMNRAVTISGGTPTLTLNDGGIASYDAAATAALGDPAKMVFSHTVGASDAEVNGLSFVRGDQNGSVIVDGQGKGPDFSGIFAASFSGLQIAPTKVTSVVASPSSATEHAGDTVTFTVTLNRGVSVSGGAPVLTLNDGGVAIYDAAATAALGDPTKLVFSYTVGATDKSVNGLSFAKGDLNGASIIDAAGKSPDLSGLFSNGFSGIQIATAPGVQAVGTKFQIDNANQNGNAVTIIAELGNGTIAAAWLQNGAVHTQIFDQNGGKLGAESTVSLPNGSIFPGSITALTNGGFAVAWTTLNNSEVLTQLYNASGAPINATFQVNSTGAVEIDNGTITALANGGFVAAWNVYDGQTTTTKAQIYDGNGARVGNEFSPSAQTNADRPVITGLADGNFIVISHDAGSFVVTGQIFDAQGNAVGAAFAVHSGTQQIGETLNNLSVAALPTGGFVVSWERDYDYRASGFSAIEAQQFDAAGGKIASQLAVNTFTSPRSIYGTNYYTPEVAALADGNFVVTWQDVTLSPVGSTSSIKAQVFDAYNQQKIGTEFGLDTVNTAGSRSQVVALQGGGFAIAWGDGSGEKGQVYAASPAVTTIAAGTTLEILNASTAKLAFAPGGAALQLDHSAAFAGSITGFGGGDSIDLSDIAFNGAATTLGYFGTDSNSGGHLAVSDGNHAAALTLLGQYSAASFVLSADGHGGTLITAAADAAHQPQLAAHA